MGVYSRGYRVTMCLPPRTLCPPHLTHRAWRLVSPPPRWYVHWSLYLLAGTYTGLLVTWVQELTGSHTIAYGINICGFMLIHLHMLIYVRGALGICHVYSTYADTHWCMLCYTQKQIVFFDMIEIVQRMRVYSIYITNAQGIRLIR